MAYHPPYVKTLCEYFEDVLDDFMELNDSDQDWLVRFMKERETMGEPEAKWLLSISHKKWGKIKLDMETILDMARLTEKFIKRAEEERQNFFKNCISMSGFLRKLEEAKQRPSVPKIVICCPQPQMYFLKGNRKQERKVIAMKRKAAFDNRKSKENKRPRVVKTDPRLKRVFGKKQPKVQQQTKGAKERLKEVMNRARRSLEERPGTFPTMARL